MKMYFLMEFLVSLAMKLNTFSEIASCIMHDKNSLSFVNMKDV